MTHVLRIAHLRIALHVANPEVGNREGILGRFSDYQEKTDFFYRKYKDI